ncbi:hypothetical protein [Delftia acidovorans]
MKKIFCFALLAGASTLVSAAGWVEEATDAWGGGWACDENNTTYVGSIHIWRDDGKFLAGLPASNPRESAVGGICGGNANRGFKGFWDNRETLLDNKTHKVHFYFIKEDGTNFELNGSPKTILFKDPNAPEPQPQPPVVVRSGCDMGQPSRDWVLVSYGGSTCGWNPPGTPASWQNLNVNPPFPKGTRKTVCSAQNLPAGWVKVGSNPPAAGGSSCSYDAGRGWWRPDTTFIIEKQ